MHMLTVLCYILTHSFPKHPFSAPWKHRKTVRFSNVFRGLRKGPLGTNGLKRYFRHPSKFSKFIKLVVWKVTKCGVFPGPYFPVFGFNTEIYSVNLRIQSKCGKIWTRKTPYLDNFHAVVVVAKVDVTMIRKMKL